MHGLNRFAQGRAVSDASLDRHFRTVVANPCEIIGGHGAVVLFRAGNDVAVVSGLPEKLDKAAGVPERVEIDGGAGVHSELLTEPAATDQHLPHEGFPGRHVAVRLDLPPAHDVPASGLDQTADSFEQDGFKLLDPLIQQGLVVAKNQLIRQVTAIGRRPEGRNRSGGAFLPFPLPAGIKMGVADQV